MNAGIIDDVFPEQLAFSASANEGSSGGGATFTRCPAWRETTRPWPHVSLAHRTGGQSGAAGRTRKEAAATTADRSGGGARQLGRTAVINVEAAWTQEYLPTALHLS